MDKPNRITAAPTAAPKAAGELFRITFAGKRFRVIVSTDRSYERDPDGTLAQVDANLNHRTRVITIYAKGATDARLERVIGMTLMRMMADVTMYAAAARRPR